MDKAYAHDDAIQQARYALTKRFLVLDTETTGVRDAEVIQIGYVASSGRLISELIRPIAPIDPLATLVHGITNVMIEPFPTIDVLWPRLRDDLKTHRIYGYNVGYDIDAINRSLQRSGVLDSLCKVDIFDIMLCYASFKGDVNPKYGSFRWHKLEDALKETGIIIAGDSHDALVDAKSTRDLLQWIADQQTTWEVALQMAVDIISLDGPIPDELFESLSKITYRKKGE